MKERKKTNVVLWGTERVTQVQSWAAYSLLVIAPRA